MIKRVLKNFLSETQRLRIRRYLNTFLSNSQYRIDRKRYLNYSSAVKNPSDEGQLRAHLTMDYHRLEKGMALPSPRAGFGHDVIERLLHNLPVYINKYGQNDLTRTVLGVLKKYQSLQATLGHRNEILDFKLNEYINLGFGKSEFCGTISLDNKTLFPTDINAAERFLTSRHSARQFTGETVSDDQIEKIAVLSQRAPSVCNRQCGRLYVANTRKKIDSVLEFQNGNRGFGNTLGGVFIVTADLRTFVSLGERNQGYVDGGIFAMQTLLAIHSQKLGGCMLNWSTMNEQDMKLRKMFSIPDYEIIITLIGFGHCIDKPDIAVSPRIPTSEVLHYL